MPYQLWLWKSSIFFLDLGSVVYNTYCSDREFDRPDYYLLTPAIRPDHA